jgi:hypothetical protein
MAPLVKDGAGQKLVYVYFEIGSAPFRQATSFDQGVNWLGPELDLHPGDPPLLPPGPFRHRRYL